LTRSSKKKVLDDDKSICGTRLNRISANIAEAMYYDAQGGFVDNAIAGAAMVVTPASHNRDDPKLEMEKPHYSDNGEYLTFQPFPDKWADLYQVWNLAFTGQQEPDWPLYWAKLLTPSNSCYRQPKGRYVFHRAINLAMHIVHMVIAKNERKNESPGFDVRTIDFVKNFGKTNRVSSEAYIAMVQQNDDDAASKTSRKEKYDNTVKIVNDVGTKGILAKLTVIGDLVQTAYKECVEGTVKGIWLRFKNWVVGERRRRRHMKK